MSKHSTLQSFLVMGAGILATFAAAAAVDNYNKQPKCPEGPVQVGIRLSPFYYADLLNSSIGTFDPRTGPEWAYAISEYGVPKSLPVGFEKVHEALITQLQNETEVKSFDDIIGTIDTYLHNNLSTDDIGNYINKEVNTVHQVLRTFDAKAALPGNHWQDILVPHLGAVAARRLENQTLFLQMPPGEVEAHIGNMLQ